MHCPPQSQIKMNFVFSEVCFPSMNACNWKLPIKVLVINVLSGLVYVQEVPD